MTLPFGLCRRRPASPRAALVTGASSGIGAAFARALPADADLVLVARDRAALEAVRDELLGAGGGRAVDLVEADLATPEGREAAARAGEARGVDTLVNNAGSGRFGPFLANEPEREVATLEVNVVGATALARAVLPGMLERARASGTRAALINVSSTVAFAPVPRLAVYAASKAYVLSFTEALAVELRREPIDVLAVCPGPVRTAFGERSGFDPGAMPGAIEPEAVARRALDALGRRTVAFTDRGSEALLANLARARGLAATAIRAGLRAFEAGQRFTGGRARPAGG